jgi:hypothetical protein
MLYHADRPQRSFSVTLAVNPALSRLFASARGTLGRGTFQGENQRFVGIEAEHAPLGNLPLRCISHLEASRRRLVDNDIQLSCRLLAGAISVPVAELKSRLHRFGVSFDKDG